MRGVSDEVKAKVLESLAESGTRDELEVAKIVFQAKWYPQLHLPYVDPDTQKTREIDVRASLSERFDYADRAEGGKYCTIFSASLSIEVKNTSRKPWLLLQDPSIQHPIDLRELTHHGGVDDDESPLKYFHPSDSLCGVTGWCASTVREMGKKSGDKDNSHSALWSASKSARRLLSSVVNRSGVTERSPVLSWDSKRQSVPHFIWVQPVIVVTPPLYRVIGLTDEVVEVDYGAVAFSDNASDVDAERRGLEVDVVTKSGLAKYLDHCRWRFDITRNQLKKLTLRLHARGSIPP